MLPMATDEFTNYYTDLLDGSYDRVDRMVLNANFALCYLASGFRTRWRRLRMGSDAELDDTHRVRMAGRFSRHVPGREPTMFRLSTAAGENASI
jgi:hypothetical protein